MDRVDRILAQWHRERPDLDVSAMGLLGRLSRLSTHIGREIEKTFAERGLSASSFDVLATLRRRMVELSAEIAQGAVWANGARSHMAASLAALPAGKRDDPAFFIGDMIPTCIDDDRGAAAAVNRRTLTSYVKLPNYQNYWIEAGYADEMTAIRAAVARNDDAAVRAAMSDRWLGDVTLFGSATAVRDGVEAWQATGVRTVILVPSSTRGGQMVAFEELIAAYR